MNEKETGGPAFTLKEPLTDDALGMTLRQYAAIKLKVPNSGTDWLDEMIRASLRDDFAANAPTDEIQEISFRSLSKEAQEQITGMKHPDRPAYQAHNQSGIEFQLARLDFICAANAAIRYKMADAMLEARKS